MKQSQLFTKTQKNPPAGETTVNARLLVQAGFVDKLMAGNYSYLPLGMRVLEKIRKIIREEMNAIGGQEVIMPVLHPAEIWKKTQGWDNIDVLFKIKSRTEKDYALGQSEEEVVTPLAQKFINSYKDLPLGIYQIHWKYRDELRAKSGLLRGKEFEMKDLYSFHVDQKDFERYYAKAKEAYFKIYQRVGLEAKATEASGGSFTEKISYEFMVLTDAGEDDIFYCDNCDFCINAVIAEKKEKDRCPKCRKGILSQARASEAGNVFDLGQKYAKDFNLTFIDKDGEKKYPIMGCYGIGTTRLMGIIVEKYHDEKGIIWPESVAPFKIHLISLGQNEKADEVYADLIKKGQEVLYDDRDISAGEKFADADLIGIPYRVIISQKSLEEGGPASTRGNDRSLTRGGPASTRGNDRSLTRGGPASTRGNDRSLTRGGPASTRGNDRSLTRGGAEIKKRNEKESRIVKIEDLIKELE